MEKTLYFIILIYFALGALAFALINKNKSTEKRKANWTKYLTYFVIIHLLYFSIIAGPPYFLILCVLITGMGLRELLRLPFGKKPYRQTRFSLNFIALYAVFSVLFILFSTLSKPHIYFCFFVVTIFDAFSQISGQLMGKKKLIPSISPQKTINGLIGGAGFALLGATFLRHLVGASIPAALFFALIIVIFALAGDLAASFYKRKHEVKDFSNLLPGHGGFLDRFDSLIPGGAAMYLINAFLL